MFWFTADEHYGHDKIIEYCNRPFSSGREKDAAIIANHNRLGGKEDVTVHVGDFCWANTWRGKEAYEQQLNGGHMMDAQQIGAVLEMINNDDCWIATRRDRQIIKELLDEILSLRFKLMEHEIVFDGCGYE